MAIVAVNDSCGSSHARSLRVSGMGTGRQDVLDLVPPVIVAVSRRYGGSHWKMTFNSGTLFEGK